jgi:hypothetical protein
MGIFVALYYLPYIILLLAMTKMIIKNTGATQQVVINFENFVKQ